jgi:hypothetical protein
MEFVKDVNPNVLVVGLLVTIIAILFIVNMVHDRATQTDVKDCNCVLLPKPIQTPSQQIQQIPAKNKLCLYYASWCHYSKIFLPEWEKIKHTVSTSELKNKLECNDYECTENKELCSKYNIRGFPSIILHKVDGSSVEYPDDSPRTVEAILKFAQLHI